MRPACVDARAVNVPCVRIKISREDGRTADQKAALIRNVTNALADVLGKDPANAFVVVYEVETEDRGIGGRALEEYRDRLMRSAA